VKRLQLDTRIFSRIRSVPLHSPGIFSSYLSREFIYPYSALRFLSICKETLEWYFKETAFASCDILFIPFFIVILPCIIRRCWLYSMQLFSVVE
jgi:hypothetical protein